MKDYVTFDDKGHIYSKHDKKYTSVTTLIGEFKQKFNEDHWSTYKAANDMLVPRRFHGIRKDRNASDVTFSRDLLREFGGEKRLEFIRRKNNYIADWEAKRNTAAKRGTEYHEMREARSYKTGKEINTYNGREYRSVWKKQEAGKNKAFKMDLWELEDGFYPELLLWNDEYGLAGQADKVFIETKGVRYIDIDDYKIIKKLDKRGYMNKYTGEYTMMHEPIDHIEDCNLMHYTLQLSMYAWMLEQFGFTLRSLCFHNRDTKVSVKYLKNDIQKILFTGVRKGLLIPKQ